MSTWSETQTLDDTDYDERDAEAERLADEREAYELDRFDADNGR